MSAAKPSDTDPHHSQQPLHRHRRAPSVHGISGNHYLDPSGEEIQLSDPRFLRAGTIYAAMQRAGVPVLAVTAKDKLRRLLAQGDVPAVSAERAHEQSLRSFDVTDIPALVGTPTPTLTTGGTATTLSRSPSPSTAICHSPLTTHHSRMSP